MVGGWIEVRVGEILGWDMVGSERGRLFGRGAINSNAHRGIGGFVATNI